MTTRGAKANDLAEAGLYFRAFAFADLLTNGKVGQELSQALQEHFATVTRSDVFLGVRIALSIWMADFLEAQAERDAARLDLDAALIELSYLRRQVEVMNGQGSWLKVAAMQDPARLEAARA